MEQKEECFTTVAGPDGKEVTIQTKPVDSNGKQPVEEKVLKVRFTVGCFRVQLVDEVLALNFVQISQFTRLIKVVVDSLRDTQERLGLPDVLAAPVAAAPVAAAPAVGGTSDAGGAAPAAAAGEKKEKKTANVKLVKYDAKDKIKVGVGQNCNLQIIKEVRGLLGLGLKESKTMVESVPVVLKENMPKAEAEALVAKLKELGAETVLE